LRDPFVASRLNEQFNAAELTVSTELRNTGAKDVSGTLRIEVDGKTAQQAVDLKAGEAKTVRFEAREYPVLKWSEPKLWWPYTLGPPTVYRAKIDFLVGGAVSDAVAVRFGIRQVTSELTEKGHRLFRINGRRVLIRGAAWAPDLFLR